MENLLKEIVEVVRMHFKKNSFKKACKKAERMHRATGKRYVVYFIDKKYIILSNRETKEMNRKLPVSKRMNFVSLMENANYITK